MTKKLNCQRVNFLMSKVITTQKLTAIVKRSLGVYLFSAFLTKKSTKKMKEKRIKLSKKNKKIKIKNVFIILVKKFKINDVVMV